MAAPPFVAEGAVLGGRYRVVRELSRGGMGVVFEAVQQDLNRRVALKVLFSMGAGRDVERFRREAKAAAELAHPNIVQVTDFQTPSDGPPFLVMELLEGVSLGALIDREGPLPYPRVVFIVTQVLAALAAAHRAGIVHRDIKPDNVFLTATPVAHDLVKLLDFGVAKTQADAAPMTAYGQVLGTPAYMAPEQAQGAAVDVRTDLFAVGATMYHAITGRPPTQVPLSVVRPDLPAGLTALVDRAMSVDPGARFATADEMRAALSVWTPSTTTAAPPAPTADHAAFVNAPTVATHAARRRGVGVAALLLLVAVPSVALVAASALLYARSESAAPSAPAPKASAVASVAVSAAPPASSAELDAAVPAPSRAPPAPVTPSRPVHVVVGGATAGHWGGPRPVAQAIENHGRELVACFPKFDPPPGKQVSRDYRVVLDGNARAVEVQIRGPNDAVDRCVAPVLRRMTYPPYVTPIDGQTFGISPRINWIVDG